MVEESRCPFLAMSYNTTEQGFRPKMVGRNVSQMGQNLDDVSRPYQKHPYCMGSHPWLSLTARPRIATCMES
jgi:hypothetical protein